MQFLAWKSEGTALLTLKSVPINIFSTIRTQQKLLWHRIHSLNELYEHWFIKFRSESLLEIPAVNKSCTEFLRTLLGKMMNFLAENPCKSTCNAKTSWWQVINGKQVKDFIVEMPFCARIYFPLGVSSRFLSKRSHIFQMLKSEWKSYFIQPSPTLWTLSSGKKENFIMNFTLSWKTLEILVFCC